MKAMFTLILPNLTAKVEFVPRTPFPSQFYTACAVARMVEGLPVVSVRTSQPDGSNPRSFSDTGDYVASQLRDPEPGLDPSQDTLFVTFIP